MERKVINQAIAESTITNEEDEKENDIEMTSPIQASVAESAETVRIQSVTESMNENENDNDDMDEAKQSEHMLITDDELSILTDSMKISLNLKWIDLKNNKGITTEGVDKLNQIYVKKIEPNRKFVLCVEGCSYQPNSNWDLSLL